MIYLASRYSHPDPLQRKTNFLLVRDLTALLIKKTGRGIFSPIVYCHEMAEAFGFPTDAGFWHQFNMAFLRRSEELWQFAAPNWEESKGCQVEHQIAKSLCLPIRLVGQDGEFLPEETAE